MLQIERARDADIGHRAEPADQHEHHQSPHHREPAEPLVAIGDRVVELEVSRHGDHRRHGLRGRETEPRAAPGEQHDEIDEHADGAHDGEGDEAERQDGARRLVEQQAGELQQHEHVELALAAHAGLEAHRHLAHPQAARRREHEIDQDLEALRREARGEPLEERARQGEEPAHRVGEPHRQHRLRHPRAEIGDAVPPRRGEPFRIAPGEMAASHHEIGLPVAQDAQHLGQPGLVVLEVPVDHRDEGGARRRAPPRSPRRQARAVPRAGCSARAHRGRRWRAPPRPCRPGCRRPRTPPPTRCPRARPRAGPRAGPRCRARCSRGRSP